MLRSDTDSSHPTEKLTKRKAFFLTLILSMLLFVTFVAILEVVLRYRKTLEFPFQNALYPYVVFRPPANYAWRSPEPSLSSRNGDYAVAYTNEDSLRIASPHYQLEKQKPADQVRIPMIGGSTVHVGTTFRSTLPGALKNN